MIDNLLTLIAKLFLGKGIDKKLPFLVNFYKKVFQRIVKDGEIEISIPLGLQLFVSKKDCGMGMYLRTKGEFESVQTRLFIDSLRKEATVFDVGANVGYYTLLASKIVGSKGKVYAFEPDPNNLKLLHKNVYINNCKNVTVIPFATSDKNGQSVFSLNLANPGESRLSQGDKKDAILVKTITIDSYVKSENITHVDIIKMDIEGAEIKSLLGGKKFFKNVKNIKLFVECNPEALNYFSGTVDDLIEILGKLGFSLDYIVNEKNKMLISYRQDKLKQMLDYQTIVSIIANK